MTWIRRAPVTPPPHACKPPLRNIFAGVITCPDGRHGDLWRCDDCGTLWKVENSFRTNGPEWRRPGWWTRQRYRNKIDLTQDAQADTYVEVPDAQG